MHYRHLFHAGNFADVFKHVVLCGLLQALNRKDKPWHYFETHAGAGRYDLGTVAAQTTAEWREGVGLLWHETGLPEPMATWLRIVRDAQPQGIGSGIGTGSEPGSAIAPPRIYPGSPHFAEVLARSGDRMTLCEKIPDVFDSLKMLYGRQPNVALHQRDGYELASLLPPAEKRGLVLIDPPFERPDEFDAATEFVARARNRFAGGVFALWHPVKNRHAAQRAARRIAALSDTPSLHLQLDTDAPAEGQMRANGVIIVNPPYRLAEELEASLQRLGRLLKRGPRGGCTAEWLGPAAKP